LIAQLRVKSGSGQEEIQKGESLVSTINSLANIKTLSMIISGMGLSMGIDLTPLCKMATAQE